MTEITVAQIFLDIFFKMKTAPAWKLSIHFSIFSRIIIRGKWVEFDQYIIFDRTALPADLPDHGPP